MDEDSDYELLPHEELEELRREVSSIKKDPLGKKYDSADLIASIHRLTETINNMNGIFTATNQEMMAEFQTHSIQNNFKILSSQNEEIARGILSVAQIVQSQTDLLTKLMDKLDETNTLNSNSKTDVPVQQTPTNPKGETPTSKFNSNVSDNEVIPSMDSVDKFQTQPSDDFPPMNMPSMEPPKKKGLFGKFM